MNNAEYLEYKGFEKEIKETLESEYSMAMYNGDVRVGYEMIGKLMAYKLIEKDDPRIEDKNKSYVKAGVNKDHRFPLDYRKDSYYIPAWLYGNITAIKTTSVATIEHWGKRVEGNYEGDIMFPSRNMSLRLTLCQSERAVENAFDGVVKIMRDNKVKFNRETMESLCKAGVYKVYEISVDGSCINQYKNIGYAIFKMGDECPEGTLVLNYASLIGNWLPINGTISALKSVAMDMVKDSKCGVAIKSENAYERQRGLLEVCNNMTVMADKRAAGQA